MRFAPRWKILLSCALLCLALGLLALKGGWKKNAVAVGPGFNGVFPAEAPGGTEAWAAVNAFPKLNFEDPLWLVEIPGTGDLLVLEKGGKLKRFPNDPEAGRERVETVLDLGDIVQVSEDQGLYQVAFHPDFGKPGAPRAADLFLTYNYRPPVFEAGPDRSMWRLSRFQWRPDGGERAIDRASETVLIQQYDPDRWHNGGAMAFDGQGFLLFTCGDGGGTDDRLGQSQTLDGGFFGGVFRIDVDDDPARSHAIRRQPAEPAGKPASFPPSFSRGYGIPRDNPWLDAGGGRLEETWALGLRSPHSAHFDAETGDLWVGDVGRTDREELNRVNSGVNLQWPSREGTLPGPRPDMTLVGEERPPAYAYDRGTGGCIIGGMRYRGAKWADRLGGQVIFGDNLKGGLHALALDPAGGAPSARQIAAGVGPGIYSGLANLCTDSAGEIYLIKLNGRGRSGGTIHKLVPAAPYPDPPARLSATGLFRDTAALLPSPALVPYEVTSPQWADGARMRRWIAVPNDGFRDALEEKIGYQAQGNWSFPAGTVLVKHLEMPLDESSPGVVKRLETRITVCTAHGGKYGLTYRWNETGTDATLLQEGGRETYVVRLSDGTDVERVWTYPSRADCMTCHTAAGGQALGMRAHQLSHDPLRPGGGGEGSQLGRLAAAAMFHPAPSAADLANVLASRPLRDLSAPAEHRVRSYLDANCSSCHQPAGPVPYFDARLAVPLRDQGLLAAAVRGHMPLPGGCYLKPGDTALSAVHARMAGDTALPAMPPIGRSVADKQALALLSSYIAGLDPAEAAPRPGDPARCTIAAPETAAGSEFAVTVVFDTPVPWFDATRLRVEGGSVTSVRGGGYYYVARISATAPRVTVEVPAVPDGSGGWLGRASNLVVIQAAASRLVKSPAGPPLETAGGLR